MQTSETLPTHDAGTPCCRASTAHRRVARFNTKRTSGFEFEYSNGSHTSLAATDTSDKLRCQHSELTALNRSLLRMKHCYCALNEGFPKFDSRQCVTVTNLGYNIVNRPKMSISLANLGRNLANGAKMVMLSCGGNKNKWRTLVERGDSVTILQGRLGINIQAKSWKETYNFCTSDQDNVVCISRFFAWRGKGTIARTIDVQVARVTTVAICHDVDEPCW
jgi:hypothetical protein